VQPPRSPPSLSELCIDAASLSIDTWKRQKRILERLPPHLSHLLFHKLIRSALPKHPPLLE
jgi:hypothetical protein